MKKALIIAGLFGLVFSTGCKQTEEKEDSLSIEGNVKEVRFTPGNTEPQTLTITSSTEWHLSVSQTWVSVTPEAGEAGEATLTVALYFYAKEEGKFDVAFAIAVILLVFTLIVNALTALVTKAFKGGKGEN